MSATWMLVRGAAPNPSSLKFQALMNKQSIAENELFKPERQRPSIISAHTEDTVLLQDPFFFTKLKPKTIHYKGPFEPDGVLLKYWCRFNHIARKIKDYSFSQNYTYPVGNPKLCEGPDDGVKGGTIVTKINSNPDILDYFYVKDTAKMRVTGNTTGFSMYFKFLVEKLSFHNGESPALWFKVDDSSGNNGVIVRIDANDATLKWFVRRSSTTRNFISATNSITEKQWYTACLTYTNSNVMAMRINNIPQTDSANETPTFPSSHSLDTFIGIGTSQNSGKARIRIADARWYNLVFSSDHMDNIWNNARSISPIEYGSLAVAGYSRFNDTVDSGGFDSTGFDSTGYDTT